MVAHPSQICAQHFSTHRCRSFNGIAPCSRSVTSVLLLLLTRLRTGSVTIARSSSASSNKLTHNFSSSTSHRRHEIAFVFGQMSSEHSVPALLRVLRDDTQSDMVRHEAAEALGGIGAPDLRPILEEWAHKPDAPRIVRESCEVAIDMWEVRAVVEMINRCANIPSA
jgi:deoxyhypusine monooxygenase